MNGKSWDERPQKGKRASQRWKPKSRPHVEQQRWMVREQPGEKLSCPAGHLLQQGILDLASVCSVCSCEFVRGQCMWACRKCDFDMCASCRHSTLAATRAKPEAPPSPSASPNSPGAQSLSEESTESVQDNGGSSGTETAETELPASSSTCDEWWQGENKSEPWTADDFQEMPLPDPALSTEVAPCSDGGWCGTFFPQGPSLGPGGDMPPVLSRATIVPILGYPLPCLPTLVQGGPPMEPLKTSADVGIESVVEYMSQVALERYPSRSELFEAVQRAASEALADDFGRFALIGSTALGIDTPDSDLDAVVFTKRIEDERGVSRAPRGAVDVLRGIRALLAAADETLQLQLVDCTRVPVLTVVTADSKLSLDLTVDEPLGERHVLWFRRQATAVGQEADPMPLCQVPVPAVDAWVQGLEAAALRCVKWWLRRRSIPLAKEGGYPSVVWTLMVLHVLRSSPFLSGMEYGENRGRSVLMAMVAFFDRFAESGLVGTFRFSAGRGVDCWQQQLEDMPWPHSAFTELSVLDPTTTCEENGAWGQPLELAPRLSPATQLLHTHELRRAKWLSNSALLSSDMPLEPDCGHMPLCGGAAVLQQLFCEVGDLNVLPAILPQEPKGALVLSCGRLIFGLLHAIKPKPGWCASFLHRRDAQSRFSLQVCEIGSDTGLARVCTDRHLQWFRPCEFVCLLPIRPGPEDGVYELEVDSVERWWDMRLLVYGDAMHRNPATVRGGGSGRVGGRRRTCRQQARA